MRLARRLVLSVGTALLILSFGASAASADALRQAGIPLPVLSPLGFTATNVTFTGAFAQPVTCTTSTIASTITVNNALGAPVRATVNNWAFGGCSMPGPPPVNCAVTVVPFPWANALSISNGPPKTLSLQFPGNAVLTISCGAVTCAYVGAGAVPPASVTAAWADSPTPVTPATATFTNAPLALVGGPCGNPALFNAKYSTTINDLLVTP